MSGPLWCGYLLVFVMNYDLDDLIYHDSLNEDLDRDLDCDLDCEKYAFLIF